MNIIDKLKHLMHATDPDACCDHPKCADMRRIGMSILPIIRPLKPADQMYLLATVLGCLIGSSVKAAPEALSGAIGSIFELIAKSAVWSRNKANPSNEMDVQIHSGQSGEVIADVLAKLPPLSPSNNTKH